MLEEIKSPYSGMDYYYDGERNTTVSVDRRFGGVMAWRGKPDQEDTSRIFTGQTAEEAVDAIVDIKEQCRLCKYYFNEIEGGDGECRKSPPVAYVFMITPRSETPPHVPGDGFVPRARTLMWPNVDGCNDWCGEFKAKSK